MSDQDMRAPGEAFCAVCPDHEACMQGYPCSVVRDAAHDAEMAAARDADRAARVCCGGECSGCPVGDANLAGLVADMQDDCDHQWLDRPESDTHECLICGIEGQGEPPTADRVARRVEGGAA